MTKAELRKALRAARRDHVAALPEQVRALVFHRPPAPLLDMIADHAVIGLYHAREAEAPAASYARFFAERGHRIALPRFGGETAAMEFALHGDPFGESDLVTGPFGLQQPEEGAEIVEPDVLFMPLVGFTAQGQRLGQGGGHYDRWLASRPATVRIGLAWDAQLVEELPVEPHDMALNAIVTPTRLHGPF
ncbi:5-formyltetrahydrofolate cyclo-ligase [Pelagerythrobacter marinus]|uniref:5-formyltetrahydrofolate cyclo-ligase n=1 Tax=Pelagerythrobacter marinus TaxID=538382 RepID=UPI002036DF7B|nr:5-formyltetrahydrofolate cyclo-ligase [Pelagerythrobacter marinus]USA40740.1 5-formyltetrahydrofolate cyclo-ligase [Pelagerythrobacter marinus]WPZ08087.1 5-formyltetrahydrofolate cyclo-ligase [Pelagerythrobacter marinus]